MFVQIGCEVMQNSLNKLFPYHFSTVTSTLPFIIKFQLPFNENMIQQFTPVAFLKVKLEIIYVYNLKICYSHFKQQQVGQNLS